jgi:hypothetical protein
VPSQTAGVGSSRAARRTGATSPVEPFSRRLLPLIVARFLGKFCPTLLTLVLSELLFLDPSPELREHVLSDVEGRLLVESFERPLEVDQATLRCFFEEAERNDCMGAALQCGFITLPLVDENLVRFHLDGQ